MNFRSDVYLDYDLDEDSKQDAFTKFNARIAIENSDGVWWVAAFGLNLTDELTYGFSVDTPLVTGAHTAMINPGRIYGLEANCSTSYSELQRQAEHLHSRKKPGQISL